MTKNKNKTSLDQLVLVLFQSPWLEIFADLFKAIRKALRGLANEGIYEVVEYESTLELKDKRGEHAVFSKHERVRYLQNNVMAFQDQAWADGKFLLDYRCNPGTAVDFYRPGYKTYILVSLREIKNRGDVDNFSMEWGIRSGFLRKTELWETEISHRTKRLRIQVIFPKDRPPLQATMVENTRKKTHLLDDNRKKLPDGRWLVWWETNKPRLHERYLLKWEW